MSHTSNADTRRNHAPAPPGGTIEFARWVIDNFIPADSRHVTRAGAYRELERIWREKR
jgi:hypothetical protein